MSSVPVAFRSNSGRYNFLGTTRLTNCYAESQGNDAKGPIAVLPCDGSLTFCDVTDTPCRGAIYMEDLDLLYSVHASAIWKITSAGVQTRVGIIPGIDRVQIVRNQKATPQIVIRSVEGVFIVENDLVTQLTSDDLEDIADVVSVSYLAGYIIYGLSDGRFFISSLNEARTIDALDFATAEQSADKLVRVYADRGQLFLMGQTTIEPWVNTGATDFPFELRGVASVIQKGLLAANSVAPLDNTFFFVGHDKKVYRLNGYQPLKVSSPEVDREIQNEADQSSISATSYSSGGHDFYAITGTDWTWEYDAATGFWHKRESYPDTKWRHDHAVVAWGLIIVADRNSGSLYYLDAETYTEAGVQMVWKVRGPTVHDFPNGLIFDALHLDIATGFGVTSPTAQGYSPKAMVSWSNDGGNTFPITREVPIGQGGDYTKRVTTRRLGSCGPKGRVYEIAISDPVARSIVNVDMQVRTLRK